MAAATTTMVALAFVVPLALLVRSVARDRALTAAERDAEALAPVLAVTAEPATVAGAVQRTRAGQDGRLTVVLPDGRSIGAAAPDDERLQLARRGRAFFADVDGGTAFFLPVLNEAGTSVVRVVVPERLLTRCRPIVDDPGRPGGRPPRRRPDGGRPARRLGRTPRAEPGRRRPAPGRRRPVRPVRARRARIELEFPPAPA